MEKARLQRRVMVHSLVIGASLTVVTLAASALGVLDSLEYWLYDQRAAHCQLGQPAPTSQLVHLDIDDASVSPTALGRWPWARGKLARILDEIRTARPSAVGLDILLSEPQGEQLTLDANGKVETDDPDAHLVEALQKLGNSVLAASFLLESEQVQDRDPPPAMNWVLANLEMGEAEFARRIGELGGPPMSARDLEDMLLRIRTRAMKRRIDEELSKAPASEDALCHRLLPGVDSLDESNALRQLLAAQYAAATAERAVSRFGAPAPPMAPPPAQGDLNVVPMAKFSDAAADCAFANYNIFENATVRSIPLFVEYRGRLFPQMGLALACTMLGANPAQARFEGSNIVIDSPGRKIVIPTFAYHSAALGRWVPLIAPVPWFGTRSWETMYDWPAHRTSTAHISVAAIWDICDMEQKISANAGVIDLAIANILDDQRPNQLKLDPDAARKYAVAPPPPQDVAAREKMAQVTLKELKDSGWQDVFARTPDKELGPDERLQKLLLNDAVEALQSLVARNRELESAAESKRAWLGSQLKGKGVLIGYTATGFQDQVSTSLHLHCPGVVVHGVIASAVLTGNWWRMSPWWATAFATLALGMIAAAVQGQLQPLRAGLIVAALLIAYLLFNGFVLFDYFRWILGIAAPAVAIVLIWAGSTLDRLILEGRERNRIAMENAVISREMELARQVQVALYPTDPPKIVGLEAEGWALTASVTGGDCYDLWQLKDGRLAVLLADASGHGLGPAMIVSQVRTLARTLCDFENHPHGLLARINRRLAEDLESTRFVTAFLAFMRSDGTMEWASAGHGPMYWSPAASDPLIELDSTGLPLGVMDECFMDGPPPTLTLQRSGSLIIFSDGIFESHAPDRTLFGVERTRAILEKFRGASCATIIEALRSAVQSWQRKIEPDDDQTIVVVRRI